MTKSALQYHIDKLKSIDVIKKVGYGTWECVNYSEKEVQKIYEKSLCNTKNDSDFLNLLKNGKGVVNFRKLLKNKNWNRCLFCGDNKFHVHHMVPRNLRGSDNFSNLVPLCAQHHSFVHLNGFDDAMRSKLSDFHKSIKSVDDIFIKSSVRGHAFIYTLRISKFKNWENRESFLKKKKVDYLNSNIANGQGHRIIINGFKVWLFNKKIVIYSPKGKSYFRDSAFESKHGGIRDCFDIIYELESLFKISLRYGKHYHVKVVRQHYADVKNELAKQYDDDKNKLFLFDEKGLWLIIDNSFNLHELETVHSKSAVNDMDGVIRPFFNSLKDRPFTAYDFEQVFKLMNQVAMRQVDTAGNLEKIEKLMKEIVKKL